MSPGDHPRARRPGDGMTWGDWTRLVASCVGVHGLTDYAVNQLLWEGTAWPVSTDLGELATQLIATLVGPPRCPRCAHKVAEADQLCARCAIDLAWPSRTAE